MMRISDFGSRSPMNFIKKIAAIFFGVFLSLVLLEISLRIYNPFHFRVKGNKIFLPINQTRVIKNEQIESLDKTIFYASNLLGFRGPNPPKDFNSTLTIVTVGGSTTESVYISEGKTWSDILSKRLKSNFGPLWLNNAGLDGHSTFGHIVLMEDYLSRIKPKAIIFLVGANDIGRFSRGMFDENNIRFTLNFRSTRYFLLSLARNFEVMDLMHNAYRWAKAYRSDLSHGSLNLREPKTSLVTKAEKHSILENHRHFLNGYRNRLMELIRLSKSIGAEPIFITQPMLLGDARDPTTGVDLGHLRTTIPGEIGNIIKANGKLIWQVQELYNDVLREISIEEKTGLVDLARKLPKNSEFFYDNFHFTNAGSRKVAQILYEALCPHLAIVFPHYVKAPCSK